MSNKYVIEFEEGLPPWPRLLSAKYDPFFKVASGLDIADMADGNVEATSGWFALIDMRAEVEAVGDAPSISGYESIIDASFEMYIFPLDGIPSPGVYVTTENEQGLIFAWEYETREEADKEWARLSESYADWCGAEASEAGL